MRDRVASLRRWLLGGGIVLLIVIAAFVTYARLRSRFHHIKLPGKLGVNIMREAGGWTLSRSKGSKTLYTIHAAKLDQGRNGKSALHDVSITVYGGNGDRRDRIYGQEFEYDEKDGIVRALGQVYIDLQGVEISPGGPNTPAPSGEEAAESKVIHVTTSGLVYLEKLGVAATSEYIEFRAGGMTGHATGADYSSDSGVLSLHSAVSMTGTSQGRPMQLTAATAQFDQRSQQAKLTGVRYESAGRHAQAAESTLYRRADGTVGRVEARGNVTLEENGAHVAAQHAEVLLNTAGQPESVVLTGGVRYNADQPLRKVNGQADQAQIAFAGEENAQPQHAVFSGQVHMIERARQSAAQVEWSSRELTATKFEAAMVPGPSGNAQLRNAEASGNARLVMLDPAEGSRNAGETDLAGDDLKAKLVPGNGNRPSPMLDSVTGTGHTVVRQMNAKGVEETSAGDTLNVAFRRGLIRGKATGISGQQASTAVRSAVQEGHVTVERRLPAKTNGQGKGEDVEHAAAEKAVYDGDSDQLMLSGAVRVNDADGTLWANQVALDRVSGDARATGRVKADYAQAAQPGLAGRNGGEEPMHVLADRAALQHASGVTTFYGSPVRAWQGASQVQAPEIEIARQQQRMVARGAAGNNGIVRTVLANGTSSEAGAAPGDQPKAVAAPRCGTNNTTHNANGGARPVEQSYVAEQSNVMRITSGGLTYSGMDRQAVFTGGVRVDTAETTMRAAEATAYLHKQREGAASGEPALQLTGGLDRVVATGRIAIARPGLNATGSRLVYTAANGILLLTGEKGAPPRAVGAQGTTSGAALRFNSCDDSVEALGEVPGTPAERVSTKAVLQDKEKGEGGR